MTNERSERELANMIVGAVGATVDAEAPLKEVLSEIYIQIVKNKERERNLVAAVREFIS